MGRNHTRTCNAIPVLITLRVMVFHHAERIEYCIMLPERPEKASSYEPLPGAALKILECLLPRTPVPDRVYAVYTARGDPPAVRAEGHASVFHQCSIRGRILPEVFG